VTLSTGSRLGPYEILSPIGAGGMGEVYRARDTRLERTVAVKVLPQHLSSSSEVRQRFEREAKTISQLSHPHICALYDIGNQDGVEYLVMEYLEGETLADRLVKGPLPLEQTLRYGIEIAGALDKAHRQGIVHRDLKPGNVMLTKSGVKLLDFGLAKAMQPASSTSSLSVLPTQAGSTPLTQEGTILGTFQYMAPEQLEGKEADARTDIFAFGAVLYEMATGRRAFSGASQASLIGAILKDEPPPVSSIQTMAPPALDRVVRTCLAKDSDDRWQSAGDVAKELRWIAEGSAAGIGSLAATPKRGIRTREGLAWIVATLLAAALGAALLLRAPETPAGLTRAVQFKVSLPESILFGESEPIWTTFALSPDGGTLALLGVASGTKQIFLDPLDGTAFRAVPGTQNAESPFWSPDGRNIGFFAGGKLKRVDVLGGPVITICEVQNGSAGTWSPNGTILFSVWGSAGRKPVLLRVAAAGGAVTEATELDASRHEVGHSWPTFLPDGRHFLYSAEMRPGWPKFARQIRIGELDSPTTRLVAEAQSRFEYSSTGHLLFAREGSLFAQALDPDRGVLKGEPLPVAPEIATYAPTADADFSVASKAPVVAFRESLVSRLRWLDRSGKELGVVRPDAPYTVPRLSPSGDRLAFPQIDPRLGTADIFVQDLRRATTTRVTFDPMSEWSPVWLPDGNRLIYASDEGGELPDLFWLDLTNLSKGLLLHTGGVKYPEDVSPDGKFLLYTEFVSKHAAIWVLPLAEEKNPFRFVTDPFHDYSPRFSPDGHFVAYVAEESGKAEVYVRPFPGPGQAWQVSQSGGKAPRWSHDGREIFFLAENAVMSAAVRVGRGFETAMPVPLFPADLFAGGDRMGYEVAPDGRFLVLQPAAGARDTGLHVIANWLSGLKK
jgi:Tol biopolymer transport system component/predicted Ser/Thr protein kinase